MDGPDALADRPLDEPSLSRLPAHVPGRAAIVEMHSASLVAGEAGYTDPMTGLWVFNARYLADRGFCCHNGCRHCPYVSG